MSRKGDKTRETILDTASDLLEVHGPAQVSMADVARGAGLTRQALYLHFPNRTALVVAVIDHIGQRHGVESFRARPEAASSIDALQIALRGWARYFAKIHHVALALDIARHTDDAAAAAWEERAQRRRIGIKRLVTDVAEQGGLADGWSIDAATEAIATLCSPRTYNDLVVDRRQRPSAYERFLLAATSGFLKH
jgi:AcrR family transcriptional regulator